MEYRLEEKSDTSLKDTHHLEDKSHTPSKHVTIHTSEDINGVQTTNNYGLKVAYN